MLMIFLLYLIVFFHFLVVIFNVLAVFFLAFCEKWYVSLPLISFIVMLMTNNIKCGLTILENKIRTKLGMPRIKGFVGHYFFKKNDI
jgi:hypothetical protein